jgi:hypothetical protein
MTERRIANSLPWTFPTPADPAGRRRATVGRLAGYIVAAAVVLAVCVQFVASTHKRVRNGRRADARYRRALADWRAEPTDRHYEQLAAAAARARAVKRHKGAIGRWSRAAEAFRDGEDIYKPLPGKDLADPLTGAPRPGTQPPPGPPRPPPEAGLAELLDRPVWMHPNMPFVVVAVLTPLAALPPLVQAAVVAGLKAIVLAGALLGAAAVANHGRHRMGDWVAGLGLLTVMPLLISEFQHGNTNMFVLGAIVLHVWLYRRGRDVAAGVVLAFAVCLKLTPLLFAAYWLYQRNWRLLVGVGVGLVVFVVAVPLTALGPERFVDATGSWLPHVIFPAVVEGAPYPEHINQSLPGVFSRLLMRGNIYYGPDDVAYLDPAAGSFRYVNVLSLSPAVGRAVLTALRLGLLAVMAWAIGWRRPARDDGRRALHYGLVLLGMMLLNQRAWDHHAAVLLPAGVAVWYALAYGRLGRGVRIGCLTGTLAATAGFWLMGKSLFDLVIRDEEKAQRTAELVEAYGPTFACLAILFAVTVILLAALRRTARAGEPVFAESRIPLSGG